MHSDANLHARLDAHLDEEQIQRLLHAELAPPAAAAARHHLATCAGCHARVSDAEREEARVLDLLGHLDHPPPVVRVEAVVAAARARPARSPARLAWRRWAAGILLGLGAAGAVYAAPGSPLRRVVRRLVTRTDGAPPPRVSSPSPAGAAGAEDVRGGIAVAPGNRFTIAFSAEQPGGVAAVSLTDGADVVVRALGGGATFGSDVDRLSIANDGSSARFQVEIPRRAPWVDIRVAGRGVLSKRGARVLADGERDVEGRYLLPLSRPAP